MVHRRQVGDEAVLFGNQGDLYLNAMTWWDHETGSIWSQPLGEAIAGPHHGARLELLSSRLTTWGEWKRSWPDSEALDAPNRIVNSILSQTGIVVRLRGDSLNVPVRELARVGVVNEEVGGVPIAVVLVEQETWSVFARSSGESLRTLELFEGGLRDRLTGQTFVNDGLSLGDWPQLPQVAAFTAFPADYARLFPDGRVWNPESPIPASEYAE